MRTYLEQERHEQRMNDLRFEADHRSRGWEEGEEEEQEMIFKPKPNHQGKKPLDLALEMIMATINK